MRATWTISLVFNIVICVLGAFLYGYHISALNTPQDVITCKVDSLTTLEHGHLPSLLPRRLAHCIEMDDSQFGLVTSIFTIGGLLGSLLSPRLAERLGRRGATFANAIILGLGSLILTLANTRGALIWGRIIVGIGSGSASTTVPMWLSELAPPHQRGSIGVLNQVSICLGIFFAQVQGLYLSRASPPYWRIIFLTPATLAVLQALLIPLATESPKWLASRPDGLQDARAALITLRGDREVDDEMDSWESSLASRRPGQGLANSLEEESSLLPGEESLRSDDPIEERRAAILRGDMVGESTPPNVPFQMERNDGERLPGGELQKVPVIRFFFAPEYRRMFLAVLILMVSQQFSGINAVIFYSTGILGRIIPTNAKWISSLVGLINLLMTFVPVYLVEKTARKNLLLASSFGMFLSSILLGLALNASIVWLSAISILTFVASFAIALGPLPFLIIPELVDFTAVDTASSLGLSINWLCNFIVGVSFLNVQARIGGSVFYIFATVQILSGVMIYRYVPETRNKRFRDVWTPAPRVNGGR